ncbi:hypothetical protein ADENT20671_1369 [Actinomyces denticolens]|nr:hypothetical protein ADENT20671_1369 [Actinomyces denticolens]
MHGLRGLLAGLIGLRELVRVGVSRLGLLGRARLVGLLVRLRGGLDPLLVAGLLVRLSRFRGGGRLVPAAGPSARGRDALGTGPRRLRLSGVQRGEPAGPGGRRRLRLGR